MCTSGNPPLKFTKPAVIPASTSVTGKRRCVCVMLKPLGEQLCVVVVVETPPSQRSQGVANGASTSGFGENPEKYLFAASFMYSRVPVSYTHLRAHETPEHLVC